MKLIVGAYSQLSAGTPAPILEKVLAHVYKPLLTYLYKHPPLKLHLYISAFILEWFETNHPEMNMLIADLSKKDQLELFSGGYYQPVFQIIPSKDRSAQIEELTTFIRKRFSKRPRCIWLFNQIWNPMTVSTLAMCSIERLIISTNDRLRGIQTDNEPFVMQEMGKRVEVFPTYDPVNSLVASLAKGSISYRQFSDTLTQVMSNTMPDVTTLMINLDQLMQAQVQMPNLPTILDLFIQLVEPFVELADSTNLLSEIPFGEISQQGYLPAGWYGLDSSVIDIGSFNYMLVKYPELNHLYGRILDVMELFRLHKKSRDIKKRVEHLLLKAMNGTPYVLDSTGGCYRQSYRKLVYKALNDVERMLCAQGDISYPRAVDIDLDGQKELVVMGKNISVVMDPKGAVLTELPHISSGWNYGDTFTGYAQEAERTSMFSIRDGSPQHVFNDVFVMSGLKLEQYAKHNPKVCFDTCDVQYSVAEGDKSGTDFICANDFSQIPFSIGDIRLTKHYKFRLHSIVVEYQITNIGKYRSKGMFGSEINLSVGTRSDSTSLYTVESNRTRQIPAGKIAVPNLKNVRISDELNRNILVLASNNRFHLVKDDFSVKLVTLAGIEVLYQYSLVLPMWEFDLQPQESFGFTLGLRIERRAKSAKAKERA